MAVQLTPAEQLWSATEQTAAETMTSLTCLLAVVVVAAVVVVVVVGLSAVRVVAEWVLAAVAVATLDSVAVVTAVVAG